MSKEIVEQHIIDFISNSELNWKEVVNAINEFKDNEPDSSFDSIFSDGQLDRALDSVCLKVGWIKDRMDGKTTPNARGSLTVKLRRALGYNQ